MIMSKNSGGQLARNFRSGQIAESLAVILCRPFMSMAQIEQEEDFGIDLIGTLLKESKLTYSAEESCMIQVKISSSARFKIEGLGVTWLKQLFLPYFPLVIDRTKSMAFLYTLNDWHEVIHLSVVDEYIFVLDDDLENDPCDSFFSLGDPIMSWDINDSSDPSFCKWAYSIMKPVMEIETRNQRYAPMGRFEKIECRNFKFSDRGEDNLAINPPETGIVKYQYSGKHKLIKSNVKHILIPLLQTVYNTLNSEDISYKDFDNLIKIMDKFGIESDKPEQVKYILDEIRDGNV
ncbi:hypothetical protein [Marinomonas lutimaris]|uniref:hypothetical protein n=1 Tax=Marinomonas lutimaris TaxID=2846746 RepID=UPI001CA4B138|nr:hypothetical protein [Marinomonas lutimaris]